MNISSLQDSPLRSLFSAAYHKTPATAAANTAKDNATDRDVVALSDKARTLMDSFVDKQSAPDFVAIPADQRPSARDSADVILDFIGQRLQSSAGEGASDEELDKLFNQALRGFKQGFAEASKMIEGLGLMADDVAESLQETKSLVLDGLNVLRDTYLQTSDVNRQPSSTETVVKQVSARREQSSEINRENVIRSSADTSALRAEPGSVGSAAALNVESYRRSESVDLAVKTRDGDIVTLSFTSNVSSSRGIAAFLNNTGSERSSTAQALYQSNQSVNNRFNVTVQGELDEGELNALNELFTQVSELADEFFNGDFDQAFALASAFELDTSEFSALSLDIARSTQTSVVEAFSSLGSDTSGQVTATANTSGLDLITQMLDNLRAALEAASRFEQPKSLVSDLLANQLAQRSFLSPAIDSHAVGRLFDSAIATLSQA